VNTASRLCAEAQDGQILMTQRIATELAEEATLEPLGELSLKGLSRPIAAFNLVRVGE
jgi:class 3 adenylate cyclase